MKGPIKFTLCNNDTMGQERGKVYLVGAGPGDPKLLTLRGKELLEQAEILFYDYLANPAILEFAPEKAEKIYVGKKGGTHSQAHQADLNRQMIAAAHEGKCVVRLKGGDPFIFGRGGEEAEALAAAHIPFEVVPGVTAALGVPLYAGIPLTHRDIASSLAILNGHQENPDDSSPWSPAAAACDTLVILMGMGNLTGIVTRLIEQGRTPKTPIALIRWGTYPHQKTVTGTLETIEEQVKQNNITPPVVIVVGEVVPCREKINWFEARPLFGRRIVVTRAREKAETFSNLLSSYGAEVISFPVFTLAPPPDYADLDRALHNIAAYHTILLTSANGVESFLQRIAVLGYDLRILKGIALVAIGPKTKEALTRAGLLCDLVPSEYTAEGILEELEKQGIAGKRFLLPRALAARPVLPDGIRQKGGTIDVVAAYQALPATEGALEKALYKGPVDMITFASASTVKNFMNGICQKTRESLANSAVACIGPITAQAARACGLRVDVIPQEYTFRALTDAIIEYFRNLR